MRKEEGFRKELLLVRDKRQVVSVRVMKSHCRVRTWTSFVAHSRLSIWFVNSRLFIYIHSHLSWCLIAAHKIFHHQHKTTFTSELSDTRDGKMNQRSS